MLVELDGSDPGSSASALGHVQPIVNLAIDQFVTQSLSEPQHVNLKRSVNVVIW